MLSMFGRIGATQKQRDTLNSTQEN